MGHNLYRYMSVFRLGDRKIKDWVEGAAAFEMLPKLDVLVLHFGLHYHEDVRMRRGRRTLTPP